MQLSTLADRCCEYLASRGKSQNTIASYRTCFRQFIAHVVETLHLTDDTRHFTDDAVESFATALYKSGTVKPNSIRTRLSALSTLAKVGAKIKDARHRPVVGGNPLATIERPARKRPSEKFLTPLELTAFLEVPRPMRISIARDLLVDLGLRASELCNANVGDLIEVKGVLYLSVVVKGGHPARVPISPDVADHLKDWLLSRNMPDPPEPLLLDSNGKRLSRGGLAFMTISIAKQAGIKRWKVRPHTLRHTLNVIRRQAKLDPMVRSALLTHRSPQSIVSYEHLMPEELVDARRQQRVGLAAYLNSATGNYGNEKCALPPTQEPDA
jgi:integrase